MKLKRCFRYKDHPLIQREKKMMNENEQDDMILCRLCTHVISEASFYACDEWQCRYYLHNSCADLPRQKKHHPLHPSHTLTLFEKRSNDYCDCCWKRFTDAPLIYYCNRCIIFNLCVECVLMPAISWPCGSEGQRRARRIQHFNHPHSLSLLSSLVHRAGAEDFGAQGLSSIWGPQKQRSPTNLLLCNACGGLAQSDYYYGCTECSFLLHESCAGFPRKLRHPLHLDHGSLSLCSNNRQFFRECFLCERSNSSSRLGDFFFKCCAYDCRFWLCWSCNNDQEVVRPTIMYDGHDHKLHFVDKTADTELAKCNAYDGYCTHPVAANCGELSRTKSSILRCLDCDFNLHMLCGPLPATIKYEYHIHTLTLVDSLVDEDDYDGCYCDACETERDPRIRLYYCEECKYCAHVHCLFSTILKALSEEDDQLLELKIMGQDIWNMPYEFRYSEHKLDLTFNDVINKLNESDRARLMLHYKWDDDTNLTLQSDHQLITSPKDVGEILKLTSFNSSDIETFLDDQLEKFYICPDNKLPFKSGDLKLKTVNVEGYVVPHTVDRVMRTLLNEYGDIYTSKTASTTWKSIVYFVVCKVLRSMATTLVIDITIGDLQEWYFHLRFAKRYSCEVDFACAHLETLVRAFLGLRANKLKDQVPEMLTKKIAKLEKKIAEAKFQLETCKGYNSGSSKRSQFMIDCLKESFDMKLKKACNARDLFRQYRHRTPIYKAWNVCDTARFGPYSWLLGL